MRYTIFNILICVIENNTNLTDVKLYDDKLEGSLSKYLIEFKTNSSYSLKLNSYNLHLQSQSSLDLTTTLSQGTISIGDGTTSTIFLGGQKIELTANNIDLEYGNYGTGSEGLNVNLSKISINFTGSVIFNQRNNGALTLNSDFFVWRGWNIYFLKPDEVKTFSTSTGTITPSNLWMGLYTISQSGNSYFTGSINYARTIGGPALCFYSTFLSI